jgi:hypothetical protein
MASKSVISRGVTRDNSEDYFMARATGPISLNRFVSADTTQTVGAARPWVVQSAVGDTTCLGIYNVGFATTGLPAASGNTVHVAFTRGIVEADAAIVAGQYLKVGNVGRAVQFVDSTLANQVIKTMGANQGGNFANQPSNDSITTVSSNAGDTTQTITYYGTTTGTNTVVAETDNLNGTTPVVTTKTNWGQLLGARLSASCAGTITIQKTTGPATIITITTTNLITAGLIDITATQAYNAIPTIIAGGASTKQLGIIGTDATGAVQYDSNALNGTTLVALIKKFNTVTTVLAGDLATATVGTVAVSTTVDSPSLNVAKAMDSATNQGDIINVIMTI